MPSVLHKSETYATVVTSLHLLFSQIQILFALERYIISVWRDLFSIKAALFGCLQCNFLCIEHRPHALRGASGKKWYSITAWRTTCLYGVSYSRASPRLPDDGTSSVSETDSMLSKVQVMVDILSPYGALRSYPELLTAESFRHSWW